MVSTLSATTRRSEAVRIAILEAAVDLLLTKGPDVTVSEIAERSSIGRRTIFRYFATKDDLLADAADMRTRHYGDVIPPRDGRDVDEWLEAVARAVHTENLLLAPTFLEVARRGKEISWNSKWEARPDHATRTEHIQAVTSETWSASGGRGPVPKLVSDAFVFHLCIFGSVALRHHCHYDVDEMARLTAMTLLAFVHERKAKTQRKK